MERDLGQCTGCGGACCGAETGGVRFWVPIEYVNEFPNGVVDWDAERYGQVPVSYENCEHRGQAGDCLIVFKRFRPKQCRQFPYGLDPDDPDDPPSYCNYPRIRSIRMMVADDANIVWSDGEPTGERF